PTPTPGVAAAPPARTPLVNTTPPAPPRATPRAGTSVGTAAPTDRSATLVEIDGDAVTPEGRKSAAPAQPAGEPYAPAIHALLVERCASCHGPDGSASGTRYVHSREPETDYGQIRALVDPQRPADSVLVRKAIGDGHAVGAVIAADSAEHQ